MCADHLPAQPLALSISVKAQPPWTPPDYAAKNPVTEIERPAINRDEVTMLAFAKRTSASCWIPRTPRRWRVCATAPSYPSACRSASGGRKIATLKVGVCTRTAASTRGASSARVASGLRSEVPCPVQHPHCSCRTAARRQTVQNSCARRSLQEGGGHHAAGLVNVPCRSVSTGENCDA